MILVTWYFIFLAFRVANEKAKLAIRIGTRESELAVIQTNLVLCELVKLHPDKKFEIIPMMTKGDKIKGRALSKIGEKALFTKELEIALESEDVDLVVHSLKDMPTTLPPNMIIGGVCKRESPCDAVILHPKHKERKELKNLPDDSVIGTSSIRRIAQLKRNFPHLQFKDIRGNLNTRLRKLEEHDDYDAIILASAGIIRMGWKEKIAQILNPSECMHAVGQGAIAIECRGNDAETLNLIESLQHKNTLICCIAERALLKTLKGGCSAPIAVSSHFDEKLMKLKLISAVFSHDGSKSIVDEITIDMNDSVNNDSGDDSPVRQVRKKEETVINYVGFVSTNIPSAELKLAQDCGVRLAERLRYLGAEKVLRGQVNEKDKALNHEL